MSKCIADISLGGMQVKKLENTELVYTKVDFSDYCEVVHYNKYVAVVVDELAEFTKFKKYNDCILQNVCLSKGSLHLLSTSSATNKVVSVTKNINANMEEYALSGFVQNVWLETGGVYTVTLTVGNLGDTANTNTWTKTIRTQGKSWQEIAFLFTEENTENGNGWQITPQGATYTLTFENTSSEDTDVYLERGYLPRNRDDLIRERTGVLSCLNEYSNNFSVDMITEACTNAKVNKDSSELSFSFTGKLLAGDPLLLDPLYNVTEDMTGIEMRTKVIETTSFSYDGKDYSSVLLSDLATESCGLMFVKTVEECFKTDDVLNKLNVNNLLDLRESDYVVLDGTSTSPDDKGRLVFNKNLLWQKVIVKYPVVSTGTNYEANINNLENKGFMFSVREYYTNGEYQELTITNAVSAVFVPQELTYSKEDEMNWTVSFNIYPSKDGKLYTLFRGNSQ